MFDWITGVVERTGYIGIALLMLAENVFPPIPSEVIMPLAGFTAAQGQLNIFLVVLSGSIGSLAGAAGWYYVGRSLGGDRVKHWAARHGRWMTIHPRDVDRANDWFRRHGGAAVFFCRLIPAIRTLISIPAGVTRMPLLPFLLYSALGTVLWTALLAGAGYLLQSQYKAVSNWLNPVTSIVLGVILLIYIYRVATFQPEEQPKSG
jgi:membrane protein DedA with SNARE-associated domain